MKSKMNYDKQSYRLILQSAMDKGFEFVDFSTVRLEEEKRKQIILRHDIDYSPALAYEMAEIDAAYKIKATFALLISTPLYNPFTEASIKLIDGIHKLGHNIVLHYRVAAGQDIEETRRSISRDLKAVRPFFHFIQPVFIWHNLPPNNLLSDIEVPGMINAYGAGFVKKMYYISDSVLRHKPEEFLNALSKYRNIHLLLHPIIWMTEKNSMTSMMSQVLAKIIRECDDEFSFNGAWKNKFPDGIPQGVLDKFLKSLNGS